MPTHRHAVRRPLVRLARHAATVLALLLAARLLAEDTQPELPGLLLRPEKPVITAIQAPKDFQPPAGMPVVKFADDVAPAAWLYVCPAPQGTGLKLTAALAPGADEQARAILAQLKPLPPERLIKDAFPDFTDAIDLLALGEKKPGVLSAFATVVDNDEPRLVRVCLGLTAIGSSGGMSVSGQVVKHGQFIRLEKGRHPVVVEANHGKRGTYLGWNMSRLAPRFTLVGAQDIEELYQWQLAQWQANYDGAKADEDKLLANIRFDPATLRGQEGFFRVGRSVNGRWWFITPEGKPFYHKGCVGLNAGGMGGRRAKLPPVPDDKVQQWIAYLKEWRFNALGAWTTPEFFEKGLPYAETIEGYYVEPWLQEKFPDVWDPKWAENLDAKCQSICAPLKDNKGLLGYYLDNERGFLEGAGLYDKIVAKSPTYRLAGAVAEEGLLLEAEPKLNVRGITLLQFALSLKDESIPACKKAWEFALERHGGKLEDLAQAWGVALPAKDALKQFTAREEMLISDRFRKDNDDFVKLWVEQYYRVFTATIRKHDPNHLTLGMRHGGTPGPAVLEAEGKWADVVSRNCYRAEFYETYDEFHQVQGRPLLNGEFSVFTDSYTLIRNPIEPPGGYDTQTRRVVRARDAMDRIYSHPGVVGLTKYRWHGGGDQLWAGSGPRLSAVNPLWRDNYRAVSIAASWDRPPKPAHKPLHGQVFVTLHTGAVDVQSLPSPKQGGEASLKISYRPIALGFICRQGEWDQRVYGDGIRGEMLEARTEGNTCHLKVQITRGQSMFWWAKAKAEYTLKLVRDDARLEGTFTGAYNDQPAEGRATGFLHRPVPSPRL